ncbi:MAG: hypothetical protein FJ186_01055 [Gammaproteobacteria bacterium]|jgi:hypothetical protein|nr:hypothetical protein [Gammaproteobacteria bacterium]
MMEGFAFIGIILFGFFAYQMYSRFPDQFSTENVNRSILVFGVLMLFLILIIGLAVLNIRASV